MIIIDDEALKRLKSVYTPASEQKCRVCGAPLTFSSSEPGGSRYNCSSDDASAVRSGKSLSERLDHYRDSAWYDRGQPNVEVVALVSAYRELVQDRRVTVEGILDMVQTMRSTFGTDAGIQIEGVLARMAAELGRENGS